MNPLLMPLGRPNATLPSNTVLPVVSSPGGSFFFADVWTCSQGSWTGAVSYAYYWEQATVVGGPYAIAAASAAGGNQATASYAPPAVDVGKFYRCRVTATNPNGSTQAYSTPGHASVDPAPGPTVSVNLVPSVGAWLGASTPSRDGTFNYTTGLDEWEAITASDTPVMHWYNTNANAFFPAGHIAMLERAGHERAIAMYNWKINTAHSWAQIASGADDAAILTACGQMAAYGHYFLLALQHEADNDSLTPGGGSEASDYVAMWHHVIPLVAANAPNAVPVWNQTGYSGNKNNWDPLFPTNANAMPKWIMMNPYMHGGASTLAAYMNEIAVPGGYTGSNAPFAGWYEWARKKIAQLGISCYIGTGEWGAGGDSTNGHLVIAEMLDPTTGLAAAYPLCKIMMFWNDCDSVNNERHTIDITGAPTSGTFGYTYGGNTASIGWNYTATQVRNAIRALPNVGTANLNTVSGGPLPGSAVIVEFVNDLRGQNLTAGTATAQALNNGATGTVTNTRNGNVANNYIVGMAQIPPIGATRNGSLYVANVATLASSPLMTGTPSSLAP